MLLQRGLRERRYEAFNRLRIFQVLSVAVLGGLLWWHTPTSHIEDRVRVSPSEFINKLDDTIIDNFNLYQILVIATLIKVTKNF